MGGHPAPVGFEDWELILSFSHLDHEAVALCTPGDDVLVRFVLEHLVELLYEIARPSWLPSLSGCRGGSSSTSSPSSSPSTAGRTFPWSVHPSIVGSLCGGSSDSSCRRSGARPSTTTSCSTAVLDEASAVCRYERVGIQWCRPISGSGARSRGRVVCRAGVRAQVTTAAGDRAAAGVVVALWVELAGMGRSAGSCCTRIAGHTLWAVSARGEGRVEAESSVLHVVLQLGSRVGRDGLGVLDGSAPGSVEVGMLLLLLLVV